MLVPYSDAMQITNLYKLLLQYTVTQIQDPKKRQDLFQRVCIEYSSGGATETREILFSDPTLIARYVSENPDSLDADNLELVLQWQNAKISQFIIERDLKSHTIFLSTTENNVAFGVLGLITELDEMLGYRPLPTLVNTVLLPWKGQIVHDPFFGIYNISYGPGIRRRFKEQYAKAKSVGIVLAFPDVHGDKHVLASQAQGKNVIPIKSRSKPSMEGWIDLKIVLNQVKPPVWRKIRLDSKITLYDLHSVIQSAVGWENSHLYCFSVDKNARTFGPVDFGSGTFGDSFDEDSEKVTLHDLISQGYKKILYTYDFGDSWEHTLTFSTKAIAVGNAKRPQCIDGAGACPPEDTGGAINYMYLCDWYVESDNPEHEDARERLGPRFNPLKFSLIAANKRLAAVDL